MKTILQNNNTGEINVYGESEEEYCKFIDKQAYYESKLIPYVVTYANNDYKYYKFWHNWHKKKKGCVKEIDLERVKK